MTKVGLLYLQVNGRARMGESNSETHSPTFLLNHQDKQAHTLNDDPCFYLGGTRRVESWAEALDYEPPPPDHHPDKSICVAEEGNPWPISFVDMPDLQDRQMQYSEFENQAEQNAYAGAARETYHQSLVKAWSIACLMIFCIVSAVILLLAIQSKTGRDIINSVNAATLLPADSFRPSDPPRERDESIKQHLSDPDVAGPAILSWLLDGCKSWQSEGLAIPEIVKQTTADYRHEMNPISDFIEECCVRIPDAQVTNTEIWDSYLKWTRENNLKRPMARRNFTQRLENMEGVDPHRTAKARIWLGIGLLGDEDHLL